MSYEYSGDLKTLLPAPDPTLRDSLPYIEFSADDLSQWNLLDSDQETEWLHIPAMLERTADGVMLRGHFEDVRRIDTLDRDDPSFWVPLSTRKWKNNRFPVDTARFPIIEITYRCLTSMARPAWLWSYPGGVHFDGLQPTRTWRTIARRVPHFGFPAFVDGLTFRLYSTTRSTEAIEIQSIRFRMPSPAEEEAVRERELLLQRESPPKRYPLLDDFSPVGVYMKAGTVKRMAEIMDIPIESYWRLTLEDIARHCHNCIVLEEVELFSRNEWEQIQAMAVDFGVRFLAVHNWPLDDFDAQGPALVDTHIRPYSASPAILGWAVRDEPPEHTFPAYLKARTMIENADPNHPLTFMMREPNAFPLFAPFFAASGMAYFKSHAAWYLGDLVRAHLRCTRGQQFWVAAPAFVYGTDTPGWCTCPEMRLMINLLYSSGARGWFTFAYHNDPIWLDGHCQRSLTGPFLTFSDLWSELGHRMERFSALAPLFLVTAPDGAPEIEVDIKWREHQKAKHAPDVSSIRWSWMRGPDFALLYVVSNDVAEVTPVYLQVPDHLPGDLEIYDLTDYVRNRSWRAMERSRHLEMFPGQGRVILVAKREVCARWRSVIGRGILESDRRQISIDLELARPYGIDMAEIERRVGAITPEALDEDLLGMQEARDELLNQIYATPPLVEPRSRLIQASAGICGCDGTLCRLLGMGKADPAHEMGLKVLPLAREMTDLRLKLRAGQGAAIHAACAELAQRTIELLSEIRGVI